MPRNGSGVYTLPVGYEAVTDETATAAQHNSPLEDLASDANAARPVVAGGTGASSESAARANLGLAIGTNVQAYNANLASLSGLTLEAGKMLYATAADTLALTDLSDHVRTNILPAADGDALWDAIGLGLVAQSAKSDLTDADDIDIGGFYILTAGTTNAPSANDCSAIVAREDADNIIVTATDAVTGDVYTRSKVAGVWGDWVRMALANEIARFEGGTFTPDAGYSATVSHGLGRIPNNVGVRLECIVADASFSVGDTITLAGSIQDTGGDDMGIMMRVSDTEISLKFGNNATPIKTLTPTGSRYGLILSRWEGTIYAE